MSEVYNYNITGSYGVTLEVNLVNFEFSKIVKLAFK